MVNYRKYVLSTGKEILSGKNAENNDELVWQSNPKDFLLHTSQPGSPFVNLGENPNKSEIKESAVFCAKYSQDWRDNKKDIFVNKFIRSDMNKDKKAKSGSWNVGKSESIKVKKSDILKFEEEVIKNGKTD